MTRPSMRATRALARRGAAPAARASRIAACFAFGAALACAAHVEPRPGAPLVPGDAEGGVAAVAEAQRRAHAAHHAAAGPEPAGAVTRDEEAARASFFTTYRSAAELSAALIAKLATGVCAHCAPLGSLALTAEGRFVSGVMLGTQQGARRDGPEPQLPATPAPLVLITAGVHAREWAAVMGMHYALDRLLELDIMSDDPVARVLASGAVRFAVVPLVNPDGYEHSRNSLPWFRGNRNTSMSGGGACPPVAFETTLGKTGTAPGDWGVDLNRNFDGYGSFGIGGVSGPCDVAQNFPGQQPFDQAETAGIKALIESELAQGTTVLMSIDQHSFGPYILHPYGWCHPWFCPRHPQEERVAEIARRLAAAAQAVAGTAYAPIPSSQLYPVGGALDDWISDVTTRGGRAGIGITVELTDYNTFFPAEGDLLERAGEETLAWLREAILIAGEEASG